MPIFLLNALLIFNCVFNRIVEENQFQVPYYGIVEQSGMNIRRSLI